MTDTYLFLYYSHRLNYYHFTVLTYIEVSAVAKGVPDSFAFYLVSIANASSALGRIGAGLIADKIGELLNIKLLD